MHTGLAGNIGRPQPTSRCFLKNTDIISLKAGPAGLAGRADWRRSGTTAAAAAAAGQAATLYQSVQQYYIT